MGVFLDFDSIMGVQSDFHFDHSEKKIVLETIQDVEPIIEQNKRLQNEGDGYSQSREWRRIASIPNVIAEKWRNELGVDVFKKEHMPKVRALLNDGDWRFLRTSPGRY